MYKRQNGAWAKEDEWERRQERDKGDECVCRRQMVYRVLTKHHAATGRAFTGFRAFGPTRIRVYIYASHLLAWVRVHKPWHTSQIPAYPSEGLPAVPSWLANRLADVFAGELTVDTIGSQVLVVATGRRTSECRAELARQHGALLELCQASSH